MTVKEGDKVKIHYTGTLEDGTLFDSSEGRDPIEFAVGAKQVIKGFEEAVIGMKEGEEKEITLAPAEAYGDPNPKAVQKVPRDKLPPGDVKPGMMLAVTLPTGQQMPVRVEAVDETTVTLDMNHPLAGKTLKFKLKVEEITTE